MKKIAKKLAIFILTSFLINIFILGSTVLAANSPYKEAYDEIKGYNEESCEKEMEGYPVAIKFYEPLLEEDANAAPSGSKFLTCYEHTLTNNPKDVDADGKPKNTPFTVSSLSTTKCKSTAPTDTTIYSCKEIQIILSKSGTLVMYTYINYIYKWAATIVGLIAVMVMIFSGIQIATSGGDTEVLSSAKARIIKSLSGIAVLFLSGLILYTVNPTFFTLS